MEYVGWFFILYLVMGLLVGIFIDIKYAKDEGSGYFELDTLIIALVFGVALWSLTLGVILYVIVQDWKTNDREKEH